jgi:L-alanine-DL-glutamate epimerase-like enolase superfamily enzyme
VNTQFERDRWRELTVTIETRTVERLTRRTLAGSRTTALVRLAGGGLEGVGEEVTFQTADLLAAAPVQAWPFAGTLGELCETLAGRDLFDRPPRYAVVRLYRRWAFEAAALDLALRQAGSTVAELLGLVPRPVRFVVSPPAGFSRAPDGVRLKIDAQDLRPGLPVDIIDFKQAGSRDTVAHAADLYPDALLEDPPAIVDSARISWDTTIHSTDDIERLPKRPAAINVKPARVGSIAELLAVYRLCARDQIPVYGGGQLELGPGRTQIQQLAALFSSDQPNDVAPSAYNDAEQPHGQPRSPLPVPSRIGFN